MWTENSVSETTNQNCNFLLKLKFLSMQKFYFAAPCAKNYPMNDLNGVWKLKSLKLNYRKILQPFVSTYNFLKRLIFLSLYWWYDVNSITMNSSFYWKDMCQNGDSLQNVYRIALTKHVIHCYLTTTALIQLTF